MKPGRRDTETRAIRRHRQTNGFSPRPILDNRYVTVYNWRMAMTNAERQAKWRARRAESNPAVMHYRKPRDRRSAARRWRDAVATLSELQGAYQDWLDNLPEPLVNSATADALRTICGLDLTEIEAVDPPRGFGRD